MTLPKKVFRVHDRRWRDFRYVYPVISRRARGLSIGINLNPDGVCNFDCIYCQVDRTTPRPVRRVELAVLENELNALLSDYRKLFEEPEFRTVPPELRRLNDIAFSGDGEPTASPVFPEAVELAATARARFAPPETKIIVLTDACFLTRPKVAAALSVLDQHNGEIWAKLDAGSDEYYRKINRPSHSLDHVLNNILDAARARPIVIQSLFMRVHGQAPAAEEIAAYVGRLGWILEQGGRISLVQIYTTARQPAEDYVTPLTPDEIEHIATAARPLGVPIECFP